VQDFERVGSASGREGLRRVRPSWEKKALPCSEAVSGWLVGEVELGGDNEGAGKSSHGTDDSGPSSAIKISMLASPQGASVLNK
jgi:hypothetical protein